MMTLQLAPLFAFQIEVKAPCIMGATPATTDGLAKLLAVVSNESGFEANTFGWQRLAVAPSRCHDHFECASGFGNRRRALIGMTYLGMRHGPKEVMEYSRSFNPLPHYFWETFARAAAYLLLCFSKSSVTLLESCPGVLA